MAKTWDTVPATGGYTELVQNLPSLDRFWDAMVKETAAWDGAELVRPFPDLSASA